METNENITAYFATNKPAITVQPVSITKLQGQIASFSVTATGLGLDYQWYAPTGAIAGATASAYTNPAVNLGDAGNYLVIVTNTSGSVTSSVAKLTVNVDKTAPTVTITSPANLFETNGNTITVTGTATTSGGRVSAVQVSLNNGGFTAASLSNSTPANATWSSVVGNLIPGTNTVSVYATSFAGTNSPTVTDKYFFRVPQTLTIVTNGVGTLTATAGLPQPPTNGASLYVGRGYTLTAVPASVSHFDHWLIANILSTNIVTNTTVTFLMETNENITAYFATNKPAITVQPVSITKLQGQIASFSVTATGLGLDYQWYAPTGAIAGATASAYTNPAVNLGDAGNYLVIVTNTSGSVTSSVAKLTVNVDKTAPTVTITSPANLFETNGNTITVTGTATTSGGRVSAVQVSLNNGGFTAASLSNSTPANATWSSVVGNLIPGTNTVSVYATSFAGTNSTTVTDSYFFRVPGTLTLVTNGVGGATVTPTPFYVNRTYTLTATPGGNYLFSNVVEVANSGSTIFPTNKFSFLGESNVTLTVNFVTNLFPATAGTYYGLFGGSNVDEQSAGFLTATLTVPANSLPTFSGTLYVDGDTLTASGSFDIAGTGTASIIRKGKPALSVALQLPFDGSDTLGGTVSDSVDGWSSTLLANQSVFTVHPATNFEGNYTMLIPGFTNAAEGPAGYGYATINIGSAGAVTASGFLGDGQTLSPKSATVARNGAWPLYAPAYITSFNTGSNGIVQTYNGALMGWVQFSNNAPKTAFSGDLFWIKTGWTNGFYNAGFTNEVTPDGSVYTVPQYNITNKTVVFLSAILDGGNLDEAITNSLVVTNGVITLLTTNGSVSNFQYATSSGLLSGSFENPANSNKVTAIKGVLLQNQGYGGGWFLGTNESGSLLIQ